MKVQHMMMAKPQTFRSQALRMYSRRINLVRTKELDFVHTLAPRGFLLSQYHIQSILFNSLNTPHCLLSGQEG